jgi:2-polyprenyl-6-methoxyphenol hydroxylase-like FAD-dependent oxidoreductase
MTTRRAEPRVVIIGAGFGGLYAARALRDAPVHVTVLDRTNHHVFQPLLYQVATATLAPSDIAVPIRWLLRKQKNTEVLMAEVAAIDPKARAATAPKSIMIFSFSPPERAIRISVMPSGNHSRPASRASRTRSSCADAGFSRSSGPSARRVTRTARRN